MLLALLMLSFGAPLAAQERTGESAANGITISATAGYDGHYKENQWIPVIVKVANSGPAIEGEVRVTLGNDPSDSLVYNSPVSLATQSEKLVTLYVYLPQLYGDLTVELLDSNGKRQAAAETGPLTQLDRDSMLYGIVSEEPVELGFLDSVAGGRSSAAVAFLHPDSLPDVAAALNALDIIVFTNVDTGRLTAGQTEAIRDWVDAGGVLVATGGLTGRQTVAGLSDLLPVTVNGNQTLADLPALREHTGEPFRDAGPYLVTDSVLRSGDLLLSEEGLPLLARQSLGNGQTYFLALDPNVAPLLDWRGQEAIWEMIAGSVPRLPVWATGMQNGYSAANAVTGLSNVALPSALLLTCFLGFYVVVVGPINYAVLKRRKRPELAWLTIPGLILFFTVLAYLTSLLFAGRQVTLAEMSLVYGESGAQAGRVNSVLGLYSPQRGRYDMTLPADTLVRPFDRNSSSGEGSGNLDAVTRDSDVTLSEIRVDVGGVNTFVTDGYVPLPDVAGRVTLEIGSGSTLANISVQNNSQIVLQDAGLLLGGAFFPLGDIDPGDIVQASEPVAGASSSGSTTYDVRLDGSNLSRHYPLILDSADYYDDPAVYSRWQLLESLINYDGTGVSVIPSGAATLIAWSDVAQLDVQLEGENPERLASTAYFLELPVNREVTENAEFEIPKELLTWQVMAESGIYGAAASEFYMPVGWVEYEFVPWTEFQTMDVTGLEIVLESEDSTAGGMPPGLRLWNWRDDDWQLIPNSAWGRLKIDDYDSFIGPQKEVRIRLDNSDAYGVSIAAIHPLLSGRLP